MFVLTNINDCYEDVFTSMEEIYEFLQLDGFDITTDDWKMFYSVRRIA